MLEMTKEQLEVSQENMFSELLITAGGVTHLGKMLGVPVSTVQGWDDRGRISKKGAQLVEDHVTLGKRFKAKTLRPDL